MPAHRPLSPLWRVADPAMAPTLEAGRVLATLPAAVHPPRRGDLVLAVTPDGVLLRRLVGLSGEEVVLDEGHLAIDGVWHDEPYARRADDGQHLLPADDGVVLLADDRSTGTDSRHWGRLAVQAVTRVGVAVRRRTRTTLRIPPVPAEGPRRRDAVRLVVLDPDDRVLLFRTVDALDPDRWVWMTPGGGRRAGESVAACARRELAEEVGQAPQTLTPLDVRRERHGRVGSADLLHLDTYVAARVADATVDRGRWTAAEHRDIAEARWLGVEELDDLAGADPAAALLPEDLPDLVRLAIG